jgi:hypothetical protein
MQFFKSIALVILTFSTCANANTLPETREECLPVGEICDIEFGPRCCSDVCFEFSSVLGIVSVNTKL